MNKLIKYEFFKKIESYKIALGVLLALNFYGAWSIFRNGRDLIQLGHNLALSLAVFFIFHYIVSVAHFKRDLSEPKGLNVFMLPMSGSKIVAAKILETLIEGIGIGVLFLITVFFAKGGSFKLLYNSGLTIGEGVIFLILGLLVTVLGFSAFLSVVYLALTSSAIFIKNKKLNGILAFILIFVILSIISESVHALGVSRAIRYIMYSESGVKLLISMGIVAVLLSLLNAALIAASGILIDRKKDF